MIDELKSNEYLWELYTKKEEYDPSVLDMYQRYPYYLSRHRNIFEPEVSNFLLKNGMNPKYPYGKKFAVCITHDIDQIFLSSFEAVRAYKRKQVKKSTQILVSKIYKKASPLMNLDDVMDLEKKYKAKSTFFVLALEKSDKDFNFKPNELKAQIRLAIDRGWEIGLHGGHTAYNNIDAIKKQKARLENVTGREIIGYRNHYLRFKTPTTWMLLKDSGFKYDSTYGYEDCIGFRNGMCHPFKPFNLRTNKYIDIMEIPLNVMDSTLEKYMMLDMDMSWKMIKRIIDTVENHKGVMTILWHNTRMFGSMYDLYVKILQYCYEKDAWLTSGNDTYKLWLKNNYFINGSG